VAIVVLVAFVIGARVARNLLAGVMSRRNVRPEFVILVRESVYLFLLVVGLVVAFSLAIGVPYLALSGVFGAFLVAGLGIQDILKNYVAGFYLLIERNIRVGDPIEFDGKSGIVTDVRMRVTYLSGDDGATVIVPNAELFSKTVVRRPAAETSGAR
jgi:small-conductance mechanosensitive channel